MKKKTKNIFSNQKSNRKEVDIGVGKFIEILILNLKKKCLLESLARVEKLDLEKHRRIL